MSQHVPDYLKPLPNPPVNGDGLGLIDPFTIISIAGAIGDTVHFLQYPKDRERKRNADALLTRAAAGDVVAEAQMRLAAGIGSAADMQTMRQAGLDPGCTDPSQCGWATDWAKAYLKKLLVELQARRAAGAAAVTLWGASTGPATIGGAVQRAVTSPIVWVAVAAAAFLFFRRRRGR